MSGLMGLSQKKNGIIDQFTSLGIDDNADANAITIDSSENVGIGTTTPASKMQIFEDVGDADISKEGTILMLRGANADEKYSHIGFQWASSNDIEPACTIGWQMKSFLGNSNGDLVFATRTGTGDTAPTERMRIQYNGNISIGADLSGDPVTDAEGRRLLVTGSPRTDGYGNGVPVFMCRNSESSAGANDTILRLDFGDDDPSGGYYIQFSDSNTTVMTGSIVADSGSATNNSLSDYRLKENISIITGGLERINDLKPSYFNYIDYPNKVHQGFIAHEVTEADIDYAVFGEKDAVDENNEIKSQQFSIAYIIPQMVNAIQELSAKNDALEARVLALESA